MCLVNAVSDSKLGSGYYTSANPIMRGGGELLHKSVKCSLEQINKSYHLQQFALEQASLSS